MTNNIKEFPPLTNYLFSKFRLEDMKDQLRKRMFKKRIIRRITFSIANGLSIELNTYALLRPTTPGMSHLFVVNVQYLTKLSFPMSCCVHG